MKKLLLLIIFVISTFQVSIAQNIDSRIDSLSWRLERLQYNYDYISCEYELYKLNMQYNALIQDIDISNNEIKIDLYHNEYKYNLYISYSACYDSYVSLYESLKKTYKEVKAFVVYKINTAKFSSKDIDLLNSYFDVIDTGISTVELGLKSFEYNLQSYNDQCIN